MRYVFLTLIMVIYTAIADAKIVASLKQTEVKLGEVIQLTLTDENENYTSPDLNALEHDFTIVSTARLVSFSYVNGRSQTVSQWVVGLIARNPGVFTIPAIKIGSEESQPIMVRVINPNNQAATTAPLAAPTTKESLVVVQVSDEKPLINQQVIYTVKVLNSNQLLDADYQPPQVNDALIMPLNSSAPTHTIFHGKVYAMREQRYAIFPQKTGPIAINPPVFTALVYDTPPRKIRVNGKFHVLKVQDLPPSWGSSPWLPAQSLKLTEHYEDMAKPLLPGRALVRVITVEVQGLPAQLIPRFKFPKIANATIYPEKASEHTALQHGALYGKVTIKLSYLIKDPGQLSIPSLKLPWFNTQTGKRQVASLPARQLQVGGVVPAVAVSINKITKPHSVQVASAKAWWLAGIALMLILLGGVWLLRLQKKPQPHIALTSDKDALRAVYKACKHNKLVGARDALLIWARLHWPSETILNLSDCLRLIDTPAFKNAIKQMSADLYGKEDKDNWNGEELRLALDAFLRKG